MADDQPEIRVTELGEYIRHQSCERRFKLETNNRRLAKELPFAERLFNTLDPVLQEAGSRREGEWEASLRREGLTDLTQHGARTDADQATPWESFSQILATVPQGQPAFGREIGVTADLGAFRLKGHIDFVLLVWRGGRPTLRIVECKASRRDRTYHRIQVALYRLMVREVLRLDPLQLAGRALDPQDVECVVARIDESTNESQPILALEPLDLETEEADIDRLLADDGALLRIVRSDLSTLDYQLNEKCDGCVFNVYCLPESARERRLELLGIEPSTARVLRSAGICSIDDLAAIDQASPEAATIRAQPGFTESLELLQVKAQARTHTLPGGASDPDSHEVEPLPHSGHGQLPEHEADGRRLVRVYLLVDYDYAENRIGALTAHLTASDRQLHTDFEEVDGRRRPDPQVKERWETGRDADGRPVWDVMPLRAEDKDIVEFVTSEWTGRYEIDTGTEKQLIQGFFQKLVDAIAEIAAAEEAPIHFYVWSRSEMNQLVEACSRVSSVLLGHLSQLLGCRESLEQMIYSCLQDEVDRRYALGWTGRGLGVVTSLRWFGRRFHWQRRIGGASVALDHAFTQDIFDFKTTLRLRPDGTWADPDDEAVPRRMFEIRSRFHDSLTAPYWRAYWRTLPDPQEVQARDPRLAGSIRRYNEARRPLYLREYLRTRAQALRWVEESIRFKNAEIVKPLVAIAELPDFTLGVENAAQASIDFLRLDHHVQVTDWVATHLVPPINRVPYGRTIPVRNARSLGNGTILAQISLAGYDFDLTTLSTRCTIGDGSMVRLSPCWEDPHDGQTVGQLLRGGMTCMVVALNWDTGEIELEAIPQFQASRYKLFSQAASDIGPLFDFATVDESVSDFVADRVDDRLRQGFGTHVFRWFDPGSPEIPPQAVLDLELLRRCQTLAETAVLPTGQSLAEDQVAACVDGLQARIQLLLGPPGTGKTATTAAATLLRILARRQAGDIVLVASHTHLALNNLLQRIDNLSDSFQATAFSMGQILPTIKLLKVHSTEIGQQPGGRVGDFVARSCVRELNRERANAVLVIGGTTGALLKLARELSGKQPWSQLPDRFQVPALIVDEASMMVFPHFLALATIVTSDGEIMLAGDHRQLAPIVAHDWEREDRPPAVLYQPFVSAYAAVHNIAQNPNVPAAAVQRSSLRFTFRLPPEIRDLIARLYRRLDAIELAGHAGEPQDLTENNGGWASVWQAPTGLYLVVHDERESKQSNEVEAQIIEELLAAAGTQPRDSVAVVTPHRAQRSLLSQRLRNREEVGIIDTVERLQGGQRPTVIVSATVSDPSAISSRVEFILDLNRSNVAFSRAQQRLIVVCPESLLDYVPVEVEHYESAMLWKSLRSLCSELVTTEQVHGHTVRVLTLRLPAPP
jgi:AAA domain/PD-(D/E)XK nuclease superfamily